MVQGFGCNQTYVLNKRESSFDQFSASDGYQKNIDGLEVDTKRIRLMDSNQQNNTLCNLFEESTPPLGLTLRKTPSFLNLIETKLSQGLKAFPIQTVQNINKEELKAFSPIKTVKNIDLEKETERYTDFSVQPISEKLKASNFSADLLRIGSWERVSQYDGDLVAKCYYAKRKLVWEVLDSGLKSKIEIQWSDITAIRSTFHKNGPGILEVELNHPPLFFRETNPQPRKHTLWQPTSDFTGGQAPICRRHYLQLPEGTLERHYEKLLQCDSRLYALSQRPFPSLTSPYFSHGEYHSYHYKLSSSREDVPPGFDYTCKGNYLSQFLHSPDAKCTVVPSQLIPQVESLRQAFSSNDSNSPCSVIHCPHSQENSAREQVEHRKSVFWNEALQNQEDIDSRNMNQIEGLPIITSANQITPSIAQQISSIDGNKMFTSNNWALNKIAQFLLNDPHSSACPDEQKIISTQLHSRAENIDNGYRQYHDQQRRIINDSLASRCINFSVDGHQCLNSTSSLIGQHTNVNLSSNLPYIPSYPCCLLDQVAEEFAHEEPNNIWNHC